MKKENNLKRLMECVKKEDELLSRKDIERRLDDISYENPGYSRKQIIESQIALLEASIENETNIWRAVSLSVSLITMLVALICALLSKFNSPDTLFSVAILYFAIAAGAAVMLVRSSSSNTQKEKQAFLHRILSYMLDELKENEKI